MLTIFKIIKKILKYLNSKESIENIAISITIGFIYTFIPFNFLFHTCLICLLIILNGNLLIFLFVTPLVSLFTPSLFDFFHKIGNTLLTNNALYPLYLKLSDITLLNFTNWNNTVSLGGYIFSLILFYPTYKIMYFSIYNYRKRVLPKLKKSKLYNLLKLPTWIGKL